MLFEGFCIFGYREFCKKMLCVLMEVNKTIYGNNGYVPDKLLVEMSRNWKSYESTSGCP
jgi:hypothetical protein